MNLFDFTTRHYEQLLDAICETEWTVLTVDQYLQDSNPPDRFLILRHDVDRSIENAMRLARLEAERDIAATYYFRTKTFEPDVVRQIEQLGHEIGYHYEDLAATNGDAPAARRRFVTNLERFREVADVTTVSPHGSPLSAQYNPDLWDGRLETLTDVGIRGGASLSIETGLDSGLYYLSDVGRTWAGVLPAVGEIDTTEDLIGALDGRPCAGLFLNAHPSRWTHTTLGWTRMLAWDISTGLAKAMSRRVRAGLPTRDRVPSSVDEGRTPRGDGELKPPTQHER